MTSYSNEPFFGDSQYCVSCGLRPSLPASHFCSPECAYAEQDDDLADLELDSPPGLVDDGQASSMSDSSPASSPNTSPAARALSSAVGGEPSALSLPPAVKSVHNFAFNYSYSIPSKCDSTPSGFVAKSLPHNFTIAPQTSSVETIKLNRRLLSPRLQPVSSPRLHPVQAPSIPPVFEDEADTSSFDLGASATALSRRCSRAGCAVAHAPSTAGLLANSRRASAPTVPRMVSNGHRSRLAEEIAPSAPTPSPEPAEDDEDDEGDRNHSAFGSYLFRTARTAPTAPATTPAPPPTSTALSPSLPPSILNTSTSSGLAPGGLGARPVRFLFSRRTSPSAGSDVCADDRGRGRTREAGRASGSATVRSPSPKTRSAASGSRSRSRGVVNKV